MGQGHTTALDHGVLAFAWHRPRLDIRHRGYAQTSMSALYQLGIAEGADFILSGHAHNYERFARLAADGTPSPTGIRQFVVGTGGAARYAWGLPSPDLKSATTVSGALQVTLGSNGYDWAFKPIAGQTFTDTGSDTC